MWMPRTLWLVRQEPRILSLTFATHLRYICIACALHSHHICLIFARHLQFAVSLVQCAVSAVRAAVSPVQLDVSFVLSTCLEVPRRIQSDWTAHLQPQWQHLSGHVCPSLCTFCPSIAAGLQRCPAGLHRCSFVSSSMGCWIPWKMMTCKI